MPIANATAILQVMPLAVTLGAAIFLGEPVGWRRYTAIIIGFIGVMLIVRPGSDGFTIYSVYALSAVVFLTLRDLATRRLGTGVPSTYIAFISAAAIIGDERPSFDDDDLGTNLHCADGCARCCRNLCPCWVSFWHHDHACRRYRLHLTFSLHDPDLGHYLGHYRLRRFSRSDDHLRGYHRRPYGPLYILSRTPLRQKRHLQQPCGQGIKAGL